MIKTSKTKKSASAKTSEKERKERQKIIMITIDYRAYQTKQKDNNNKAYVVT